MCDSQRHLGGGSAAARRIESPAPAVKVIPYVPAKPQLEVVVGGQAEVRERVAEVVAKKIDREKVKPKLIEKARAQMGISSFLYTYIVKSIASSVTGFSEGEDFHWAIGVIEDIMKNREKIVTALQELLVSKIAEREDKPSTSEIDNIVEQFFSDHPELEPDIDFAAARAKKYFDEFFSAPPAPKPAPQTTHLGGEKEVSVPKAEVKVEPVPVTAEVVEVEIVEESVKKWEAINWEAIGGNLRKRIRNEIDQKGGDVGLMDAELLLIVREILPQGCSENVVEKAMRRAGYITDEILREHGARRLRALPEARTEVLAQDKKAEAVVPLAAVQPAETKKQGGLFGKLRALVSGIGQKPDAQTAAQPEKPAVVKTAETPKSKESSEKENLRNLLMDLRNRELRLPRGEKGKTERKEFYRSLAVQLAEKLAVKSTGEVNKDRELIKTALLKLFGEQELRSVGPEWLFK